ncbi:Ribokinase-like protein [Auriscalpium vulgare]|uniref:Ribokinase-like protein n=1 Tax=Auriscalpium vulgare TaxID=40419 RepID=A0ACB8RZF2_9AGAM|nr:Ribokinase-like protein [Auriscalpium vulgare]
MGPVDDIVRPGQTISSTGYERRAGGKGANQAAAVARAGASVNIVGAVGDDGAWLVQQLKGIGVSVGGVTTVQEPTGRAVIQLTKAGENCIILHKGANYALEETPAQILNNLKGISHLLLQNEIPWPTTLAYLEQAHAQGIVTVFNPSPMPSDAQLRVFPWEHLSWLLVNEGEAESLLRVLHTDAPAPALPRSGPRTRWYHDDAVAFDGSPAFKTLKNLHNHATLATVNIVCTLGATGVLASLPSVNTPLYVTAAELRGNVRDTTGAGDCFTGYLIASLMELPDEKLSTANALKILKRSAQAAGMCVERRGAMESIPGYSEVDARLEEN